MKIIIFSIISTMSRLSLLLLFLLSFFCSCFFSPPPTRPTRFAINLHFLFFFGYIVRLFLSKTIPPAVSSALPLQTSSRLFVGSPRVLSYAVLLLTFHSSESFLLFLLFFSSLAPRSPTWMLHLCQHDFSSLSCPSSQ